MNKIRKPKRETNWPERIMVVTAHVRQPEEPDMWAACFWGDETPQFRYGEMECKGKSSFCDMLTSTSFPLRDTLIIAESAYDTITKCGFWEYVRNRKITLKGIDERRPCSPRVIVESPPTIVQFGIRGRAGSALIVDPMNYGYAIQDMDDDDIAEFRDEIPTTESNLMKIFVRTMQLLLFVDEYHNMMENCGLGESWKSTAGSQAFYGFRKNYMNSEIEASTPGPSEDLIAKCSYGGRCEAFHIGDVYGPVYQLDFNQLYSAVASECPLPVRCLGQVEEIGWQTMTPLEMLHCSADVTIETKRHCLPYRSIGDRGPHDQITIYPTGQFRTYLAGPELQDALLNNEVADVHEIYAYEMSPILSEWANMMWNYRQQCEPFFAGVVKRLALSLYGKFGQRQRDWHLDPDDIPVPDMIVGDWYTLGHEGKPIRHRVLDGQCSVETIGGFVPQSSPPISAWIMSYARVWLQHAIAQAGKAYYCDTDSVWTNKAGLEQLQDNGYIGDGLGKLRVVGEYGKVTFRGIKHYVTEDTIVHAGVPGHAIHVPGNSLKWSSQEGFNSFMSHREYPYAKLIVKTYRGETLYRHGVVNPDGTVSPHCIEPTSV